MKTHHQIDLSKQKEFSEESTFDQVQMTDLTALRSYKQQERVQLNE